MRFFRHKNAYQKAKKSVRENKGKTIALAALIPLLITGFDFGTKLLDSIEDSRQNSIHAQMKSDRNHGAIQELIAKQDSILLVLKDKQ